MEATRSSEVCLSPDTRRRVMSEPPVRLGSRSLGLEMCRPVYDSLTSNNSFQPDFYMGGWVLRHLWHPLRRYHHHPHVYIGVWGW
jgi:hypothetical protein